MNRPTRQDVTPSPDEPTDLLIRAAQALFAGLKLADYYTLNEKTQLTIDAEDPAYIRDMPEHDIALRLLWLRRLAVWRAVLNGTLRESDLGLAQTEIDKLVHLDVATRLAQLLPGSRVYGEESTTMETDHALAQAPGGYVWVLDAIDGSGLQDTVGFGHSSNVLLYRIYEDRQAVVLSILVKPNGLTLGWLKGEGVYVGNVAEERPALQHLVAPLADIEVVRAERGSWVAVVAAQPQHRRRVQTLFTGDRWTVLTMGGAPAMDGLLLGKLSALIIPSWQTRHDANPLLALSAQMGLAMYSLVSGDQISDARARGYFQNLSRPGRPDYTPVEPMIIAREKDTALALLEDVREHWAQVTLPREISSPEDNVIRVDFPDDTTE